MTLAGLSSMATRLLLSDLSAEVDRAHGIDVRFESGGGVEIARRVRDGAHADVLVLADDAMRKLEAEGHVVAGSVRPLFASQVVAAVAEGSPVPVFDSEDDLRAALRAATTIAYSTGPSGTALVDLITRWGLADEVGPKLVQAPPGVPVGTFVAEGHADLAFQQRSELTNVAGVVILGPLPGEAAITSVFSGGVVAASLQREQAATALDLFGSDQVAHIVTVHGMTPAR